MRAVARAFAPGTIGNVGVGFDILGAAFNGIGEIASVAIDRSSRDVTMEPVPGFPALPLDPRQNTATAGLLRLVEDQKLKFGFRVHLEKNIPIGSGLGGSAASAVAAIVAASSLLKTPLTKEQMLHYALIGEEVASRSRHADNIAPCLHGGLVFVRSHPEISVVKIPTPAQLRLIILLPRHSVSTKEARRILNPAIPLATFVEQTANLTGFLLGCVTNKPELIRQSFHDVAIEPQRARLIPIFPELQAAAIKAGALGCSISGSGPAIFALGNSKTARRIQSAFLACAKARGVNIAGSWISPIASKGAHLIGPAE